MRRCLVFPEAAVRSQKQAESEDCDQVDIEHFEKILPQLVGGDLYNPVAIKIYSDTLLCLNICSADAEPVHHNKGDKICVASPSQTQYDYFPSAHLHDILNLMSILCILSTFI